MFVIKMVSVLPREPYTLLHVGLVESTNSQAMSHQIAIQETANNKQRSQHDDISSRNGVIKDGSSYAYF